MTAGLSSKLAELDAAIAAALEVSRA